MVPSLQCYCLPYLWLAVLSPNSSSCSSCGAIHTLTSAQKAKRVSFRRNGGTPFPSAPVGDRVTAIPDKETDVLVPGPTTTSIWCPAGVLVTTSWSGPVLDVSHQSKATPSCYYCMVLDSQLQCPATFKTGCENPRLTREQTLQPCRTSFLLSTLFSTSRILPGRRWPLPSRHCCFDTRPTLGPGCLPCQLLRSSSHPGYRFSKPHYYVPVFLSTGVIPGDHL